MDIPRGQLLEYFAKLDRRYADLEVQLVGQASLAGDPRSYQHISKELVEIRPVIEDYRTFLSYEDQVKEAQAMAEGEDREMAELARGELKDLADKQHALLLRLQEYWIQKHQAPERPILVEIRPGAGGQEAAIFVGDLYRMYSRYASEAGMTVEPIEIQPSESGGYKEVIFSVKGAAAWQNFKFESGVHRVQRVPQTESQGRIHTSTATVAVLPEPEEVELPPIPHTDLQIDVYRSSGPGGQGVNTTDSAVRIHHIPTGMIVICQDERSQMRNKEKAMRVLRARLLDQARRESEEARASNRKSQVGTGERSEKIRTYNFPDRRVTDHRIGLTLHKLDMVMEGDIQEVIDGLIAEERKQAIKNVENDS